VQTLMTMNLESVLLALLSGYVLVFLLFGITEGRKYLTSPPKTGENYLTIVFHSEETTLTLAGLAMTALALFVSIQYQQLRTITSMLLFFSMSFSSLTLSSILTHFQTRRLYSYMADVFSNAGLLALGCGFLSFFIEKLGWWNSISLVFLFFVIGFLVLSFLHLYKYHRYWKIITDNP